MANSLHNLQCDIGRTTRISGVSIGQHSRLDYLEGAFMCRGCFRRLQVIEKNVEEMRKDFCKATAMFLSGHDSAVRYKRLRRDEASRRRLPGLGQAHLRTRKPETTLVN